MDLIRQDLSEGMRIYWIETLQRAHLAAVTAILRSRRWISGVQDAAVENNLLVFAATLRGLMESAADASTALIGTPLTLAQCYSSIVEALSSQATTAIMCSELEEELIHYSHAQRLSAPERANSPRSHQVRQVQEYLNIFGDANGGAIRQCYSELCDLTHPGSSSVRMWLTSEEAAGYELRLSSNQDAVHIGRILREYASVTPQLIMFAFNAPVITLNVLNYFPVVDLHTPKILNWNLDMLSGWMKCRDELDRHEVKPMVRKH